MIRIKVCGMTRGEDAEVAVAEGVDAIGLIFAPSPRQIDVSSAKEIVHSFGPYVTVVGVFVDATHEEVMSCVHECGLDRVQLHGHESPDEVAAYNGLAYKAVSSSTAFSESLLESYVHPSRGRAFLVDLSKSGDSLSFEEHLEVAARWNKKGHLILAGGLNSTNVEQAIQAVSPSGIDLSRGVETAPGIKDHDAMRELIRRVRSLP